jgi:protein ImuA
VQLGHPAADACLQGGILRGALHEVFPAGGGDEASACGFATALAARVAAGARVLWLRTDFAALEHGEISALGLIELGLDPDRFLLLRAPDATSVLRAASDALSCATLGALVIEIPGAPKILDLSASRRLVLAAAQSGVTAFLLRLDAQAEPSAAETRWLVRAARSFPPPRAAYEMHTFPQTYDPITFLPRACVGEGDREAVEGGLRAAERPPPPLRGTSPALGGGGKERAEQENWRFPRFEAELVRHRHGGVGHWVMEWSCDDGIFRAADSGAVVSASSDRPAAAEYASRIA